jgi:hypothetical protein
MCNCGGGKRTQTVWTVTYPDGTTETKTSSVDAHVAAAKVAGARVTSSTS